jgi:hypothetical protein
MPRGNCRILFESLLERSWLTHFDFEYLVREVRTGAEEVEHLPMSPAKLARGRAILQDLEASRLQRMTEYEKEHKG